jgi:hypothetical protein
MVGCTGSGIHDVAGGRVMAGAAADSAVDNGPDIFANSLGMTGITFRLVTKLIMILHCMVARSLIRIMAG